MANTDTGGNSEPRSIARAAKGKWHDSYRDDNLVFRRLRLGNMAHGKRIGTSLYEVPPGGHIWTYHYHHVNEEAIYVLQGRGSVHLPSGMHPVEAGDYLALPTGPEGSHHVIGDEDVTLRLLIVSILDGADVVSHPDSGKIGAFSSAPLKTVNGKQMRGMFLNTDDPVPIWSGEKEPGK